jgi:hypothetical protein
VTVLYSWDASVPGREAGGVTASEDRARTAAEEWMRCHRADTAQIAQVQLVLGDGGLLTTYSTTGSTWTAQRRGNQPITWTLRDDFAPELAAS